MSNCKAASGFTNTCADLLSVGGADKTFWVGYLSELDTPIDITQTADISTLDFGSYGGLRRFDGNKFSHSFKDPLVVAGGGNKSYARSVTVKVKPQTTADDVVLQDLNLGTDIFVVIPDNNRKFFILGAANGLTVTADENDSGESGDSDTRDVITMTGSEPTKKLRFATGGGYAHTLAYLVSREI
jgi:hypothetical protein